jgi:hypothetical protein
VTDASRREFSTTVSTELANAEKKDSKITRNKNSKNYVRMHRKKYTNKEQNSTKGEPTKTPSRTPKSLGTIHKIQSKTHRTYKQICKIQTRSLETQGLQNMFSFYFLPYQCTS